MNQLQRIDQVGGTWCDQSAGVQLKLMREVEVKIVMDMIYDRDPWELVYAKWQDMLCQKLQSAPLPVFGLTFRCYAAPGDRLQFLNFSKLGKHPSNLRTRFGLVMEDRFSIGITGNFTRCLKRSVRDCMLVYRNGGATTNRVGH